MPRSRQEKSNGSTRESPVHERQRTSDHVFLDGVRHFHEADFTAATRRFTSALALFPEDPHILTALAHSALHGGDGARAKELYQQLHAAGSTDPSVLFNLATIEYRAGDAARADELFAQIRPENISVIPGRFYLGILFRSEDDFLCDIGLYRARIALTRGDPESALEHAEGALKRRPTTIGGMILLGDINLRLRNYVRAIQWYERSLASATVEEDRVAARNGLAIASYENGSIDEAVRHLTQVLREAPDNPFAVHNLNFIYERQGVLRDGNAKSRALPLLDVGDAASPTFDLTTGTENLRDTVAMVGKSSVMLRAMRHARVAATNDSTVLLSGPPGTGKELLARLITRNSPRRSDPFVIVNSQNLPELELEGELFGYEKGAFTGARSRKVSAFETADRGTLFIDEIAALSPRLQGRLFRALRERRYMPQGATRPLPIDARLIVATSKDLPQLVMDGKFREDLYYELNVIPITLPPLRERREDIPLLVEYFLRRHTPAGHPPTEMGPDDLRLLHDYDWPGNIRELENTIQRAVVMGNQTSLHLEELKRLRRQREKERRTDGPLSDTNAEELPSLEDIERDHILAVLQATNNNQRRAARILKINPSTLWRKLKQYGFETE